MTIVETILIVLLALVAAALIAAVMMQQGRGAEIGAAFGSGSANTIFGSAGIASPLARLTWGLVTVFFALSLTLAYLAKQRATVTEGFLPRDVPTVPAHGTPPSSDVPTGPGDTSAVGGAARATGGGSAAGPAKPVAGAPAKTSG